VSEPQTAVAFEACRIQVIDSDNGWPVPLVELRTTHGVRFVSDNAGIVAFDLPELMNTETWFHVHGHGYSVKEDGIGYYGVRLVPKSGQSLTIKVDRHLAAKRLGRITGGGLFAESQKLGEHTDWSEQGILGCDSVQNAVHNGRLVWGWGDTVLPHYPLGRFHMIGATTSLAPLKSFQPPIGLRYDYVKDDRGVPVNVAELAGDGPTWLSGYVSLPDQKGGQQLVATYSKIRPPLTEYEKGLCVWNQHQSRFEKLKTLWTRSPQQPEPPPSPHGHAVFWTDNDKQRWVLFGDPFVTLKCPATFEAWSNPDSWIQLTPQKTVPVSESTLQVRPHRGAIAWNDFRNKWVTVFTELGGESSYLGEIWYAESDQPDGPWANAVKVVTHDQYSFYNPQLHCEFTPAGSPILLFEATYTHTFSENTEPTPRHDYNQVLYRLDLDEMKPSQ
ncbi:MAG: hypothetical protein HKN47_09300, partial [Pirellulaceae bacterium]|nr:hypothetical protein [Pirellulaceae bacterium]